MSVEINIANAQQNSSKNEHKYQVLKVTYFASISSTPPLSPGKIIDIHGGQAGFQEIIDSGIDIDAALNGFETIRERRSPVQLGDARDGYNQGIRWVFLLVICLCRGAGLA